MVTAQKNHQIIDLKWVCNAINCMTCNKAILKMKIKIQSERNTWGWERGSKKKSFHFVCVGKHPRLDSGNSDVWLWPFPRDPCATARSQGPPTPQVLRPPAPRHVALCAQSPGDPPPINLPNRSVTPGEGRPRKGNWSRSIWEEAKGHLITRETTICSAVATHSGKQTHPEGQCR